MVSTLSVRIFRWEFCTTFQEVPFSQENLRSGRKSKSFHLHFIQNFRNLWVINGKQPVFPIIQSEINYFYLSIDPRHFKVNAFFKRVMGSNFQY